MSGGSDRFLGGEIDTEPELDIGLADAFGIVKAGMIGIVVEQFDIPVEWDVTRSGDFVAGDVV